MTSQDMQTGFMANMDITRAITQNLHLWLQDSMNLKFLICFDLSAGLTLESRFLFDNLQLKCNNVVVRRKDLHFKVNLDLHPILLCWAVQSIGTLIISEKILPGILHG